jgi:hypothetical protein
MVIFVHLIQSASSLPADASALESAISALERDITALENSSVPWEKSLPRFTALVAVGVAMEFWVIWRERRDDMEAWGRGTLRLPERPSTIKYVIELVSLVLITGGIVGELWIGIKITSINGTLRTMNGELRSESDQLVGLLQMEAAQLREDAAELEDSISWRRLTPKNRDTLQRELGRFSVERAWLLYNTNDTEAFALGSDLALALNSAHWHPTEPEPILKLTEGPVPFGTNVPETQGIVVSTTGEKDSEEAANAFVRQMLALGFDCKRSSVPAIREQKPSPTVFVFVEPRPQGPQGEAKLRAEAKK